MEEIKKIKEYLKHKEDFEGWRKTGLLDGLSEEDAKILVEVLSKLTKILFTDSQNSVIGTVMPVIVIVLFKKYNYLIKDLHNAIAFVKNNLHILHDLSSASYAGIDGECEFISLMASEISNLRL